MQSFGRETSEGDHLDDPIIKIDIQEVEWGMNWIILASNGQVVGCCECGNEPSVFTKCGEFLE